MVQPLGVPASSKVQNSDKSIARFFVDTFFLPWCQEAFLKKEYDEKALLDAVHSEIQRLEALKLETNKKVKSKVRFPSVSTSDIKCVAKGCRYSGINTNNKSAVGTCSNCGLFEHFDCSKTKTEEREEILKGVNCMFAQCASQ